MSLPPENGDPPDEDHSRDESGYKSDTRPLNPPIQRDRYEEQPPATVLQDASKPRSNAPIIGETNRVRLIPRIPDPPPWRIILHMIEGEQTTIGLDVRQPVIMGRIDPEGDPNPTLDLTSYLAREHGVSRQHAALIPAPEGLCLADLESANGTWVNGIFVEPGQRRILSSGDRVELGLLKMMVKSVILLSR